MALTRRTPAFAQLAQDIERILEGYGAPVPTSQVDAVVNLRVEQVAKRMGVTTRAALRYAPTDLPELSSSAREPDFAAHHPCVTGTTPAAEQRSGMMAMQETITSVAAMLALCWVLSSDDYTRRLGKLLAGVRKLVVALHRLF